MKQDTPPFMKNINLINHVLGLMLVFVTLTVIFPGDVNLFKQFSNYGVHITLGLFAFSMFLFILNKKRLMFVSMACTTLLCLFLKNQGNLLLLLPQENQDDAVSIAHINLNSHQMDLNAFSEYLMRLDADIISLQEYSPYWDKVLENTLYETYPHQLKESRIDPHGIALFSKLPMNSFRMEYFGEKPCIISEFLISTIPVVIYSTYITPPLDRINSRMADQQLIGLAERIQNHHKPTIIVGEFNEVYWSNRIRTFRSINNLHNSRRDIMPSSLSVPFDHIFFTNDLECTFFKELIDDSGTKIGMVGKYQINNAFRKTYEPTFSGIHAEEP